MMLALFGVASRPEDLLAMLACFALGLAVALVEVIHCWREARRRRPMSPGELRRDAHQPERRRRVRALQAHFRRG